MARELSLIALVAGITSLIIALFVWVAMWLITPRIDVITIGVWAIVGVASLILSALLKRSHS